MYFSVNGRRFYAMCGSEGTDLEQNIKMGFQEGFTMILNHLDELLLNLQKNE